MWLDSFIDSNKNGNPLAHGNIVPQFFVETLYLNQLPSGSEIQKIQYGDMTIAEHQILIAPIPTVQCMYTYAGSF